MVDRISPERRSAIMASVGTKNTKPELRVRRLIHRAGYRYRLHRKDLPGNPDVVFPKRRKVIFVHGCFWHGHGCRWGQLPKSKLDYWGPKIRANQARDAKAMLSLAERGWSAIEVWQCELRDMDGALRKILAFLQE